ncbi:MAG: hypothetical protein AAB116_18375, partial [Candidatus Poribacteria bacterium]
KDNNVQKVKNHYLHLLKASLKNDVKVLRIERGLNGFSRIFLYLFRSAQIRLICSSVTRRNEIRVYPRSIS